MLEAKLDAGRAFFGNWILRALPENEIQILVPNLRKFSLPLGFRLQEPQGHIDSLYFLESGMVSLVVETAEGRGVDVGVISCEGVVGYSDLLALPARTATTAKVIQLDSTGHKIAIEYIKANGSRLPLLHQLVAGFSQVMSAEISQVAACNRLHFLDRRLARWLLMSADRQEENSLGLTHEFLAQMVGSGRPEVSESLSRLKEAGAVGYRRGEIRILDPEKLETIACECYPAIREVFAQWKQQLRQVPQ